MPAHGFHLVQCEARRTWFDQRKPNQTQSLPILLNRHSLFGSHRILLISHHNELNSSFSFLTAKASSPTPYT